MTAYLSVAGVPAVSGTISIPYEGAWTADLELDTDAVLSGRVDVSLGDLVLSGTVDTFASGTFNLSASIRVVGGANGWGERVRARGYHNDAGVRPSRVARDVAHEVGETIFVDAAVDERIGPDFLRGKGPASRVLRQLFADATWWVDEDGITRVGARPSAPLDAEHRVLDADPRHRTAVLSTERPDAIAPGAIVTEGLDAPLVIRDVVHVVEPKTVRTLVWGAPQEPGHRLVRALSAIATEASPRALYAFPYRYRVVQMAGDRVSLQAVRRAAGLPDALAIPVWPGMAGHHAELTAGATVLVQFVEGDPSLPIITHHEPKGGPGFLPVTVAIDAESEVNLGAAVAEVLRNGETINLTGVQPGPGVTGALITVNPATFFPNGASKVKA